MAITLKPSEQVVLVGVANPALFDNAACATGWVDTRSFPAHAYLATLLLGATDIAVSAIKVQIASDGSGTGAEDILSASNLTATDDNKQVVLNVDAAKISQAKPFLRATATVGDGAVGGNAAWVLQAVNPRFASLTGATTIAQIVS